MRIALKIDVDTYRGLEEGASRLADLLYSEKIPASFFVTLGPDTSGWAVSRVWRHRGFLKKMQRTSALKIYGLRTVLSGTLLPARPMGTSFAERLKAWAARGFEVSPHGYDHIAWHDQAARWDSARAIRELDRIEALYKSIFGRRPASFAAPGWQAGPGTWEAMEGRGLLYHSDTRGARPYFPEVGGRKLETLEIPTTLPTWDELLAWDGMTPEHLVEKTFAQLSGSGTDVWTIHAEFEGSAFFEQFREFLNQARDRGVQWVSLPEYARRLQQEAPQVAVSAIVQGSRPGRAGTVTCQAA